MNPGGVSYHVNVPGIVPGAAPMGAGLVPSTGAAGAVMMWGPPPYPGRGAVNGFTLLTISIIEGLPIKSNTKIKWVYPCFCYGSTHIQIHIYAI